MRAAALSAIYGAHTFDFNESMGLIWDGAARGGAEGVAGPGVAHSGGQNGVGVGMGCRKGEGASSHYVAGLTPF